VTAPDLAPPSERVYHARLALILSMVDGRVPAVILEEYEARRAPRTVLLRLRSTTEVVEGEPVRTAATPWARDKDGWDRHAPTVLGVYQRTAEEAVLALLDRGDARVASAERALEEARVQREQGQALAALARAAIRRNA